MHQHVPKPAQGPSPLLRSRQWPCPGPESSAAFQAMALPWKAFDTLLKAGQRSPPGCQWLPMARRPQRGLVPPRSEVGETRQRAAGRGLRRPCIWHRGEARCKEQGFTCAEREEDKGRRCPAWKATETQGETSTRERGLLQRSLTGHLWKQPRNSSAKSVCLLLLCCPSSCPGRFRELL